MPCLEIISVPANDAFLADPVATVQSLKEILSKVSKGLRSFHAGIQVEDPKLAGLVLHWDSVENHTRDLVDSPSYPDVGAAFSKIIAEGATPTMYHAIYDENPAILKALTHPTTQFATFTLKNPEYKPKLLPSLTALIDWMTERASCGQQHESDQVGTVIVGWESLEAHIAAVQARAEFMKDNAELFENAEPKAFHVKLQKLL